MMNWSTLLRLTKVVFLAATLLGSCASLPFRHPATADSSKAPRLKQLLAETSQGAGTRTHEFPANSIDSLERDMREAETTTTAEIMETSPSDGASGTPTTTTGANSDEAEATPLTETESITQRRSTTVPAREQFKKLLQDYYFRDYNSVGREEVATFFGISEMYRLGPLSEIEGIDNLPSDNWINAGERRCSRMAAGLNIAPHADDLCQWTYTCNYNANRFPSMIIHATNCQAKSGAKCIERRHNVMTFSRTFNNGVATWQRDDFLTSVVYGYTCRSARS